MRIYSLKDAHNMAPSWQRSQIYNALDCIGTRQVFDSLWKAADERTRRTYGFVRSTQAVGFTMMNRGILVNEFDRTLAIRDAQKDLDAAEASLTANERILAVWDGLEKETGLCPKSKRKDGKHTWAKGEEDTPKRLCDCCGTSRMKRKPFQASSPQQVMHLLYDLLHLPVQRNKLHKPSSDHESLMKLVEKCPKHSDILTPLLSYKGLEKQLQFLSVPLRNGRYTSTFSIGTAWTGRWSAQKDPYKFGGNAQNITEKFRKIFVADPGYELCYADLKQAESNIVAHLAGDDEYIEAHASGDVHTYVTRLVWPDMPWTGDLKQDKKIAKQLPEWDPAPGHDFRFQSKRIQHGSNYGLSPFGIALIAHIPVAAATAAQRNYFRAFPHIQAWQKTIRQQVQDRETLVNPLGIGCRLFGRPWDEHTYKQGLAYKPQGLVAHIINCAAWSIWNEMDPEEVEMLAQIHDALMWQHRIEARDRVMPRAVELFQVPVPITDIYGKMRVAQIEVEAAVGRNWSHYDPETNPEGIREWPF